MISSESFKSLEMESFSLSVRPNRSLSRSGRLLWLVLIAATTLLVAGAASAIGAWLILPFAGLEIVVMWYAFRVVAQHDEDYETLYVSDAEFRWEQRCGQKTTALFGNRYWARLAECLVSGHPQLELRYAGSAVVVGRLMPDEQRKVLAKQLRLLFPNV